MDADVETTEDDIDDVGIAADGSFVELSADDDIADVDLDELDDDEQVAVEEVAADAEATETAASTTADEASNNSTNGTKTGGFDPSKPLSPDNLPDLPTEEAEVAEKYDFTNFIMKQPSHTCTTVTLLT